MSYALFTVLMVVVPLYVVIGICVESLLVSVYRFNLFVFLLWPLFVAVKFIKVLIKKLSKDFIEAVRILF